MQFIISFKNILGCSEQANFMLYALEYAEGQKSIALTLNNVTNDCFAQSFLMYGQEGLISCIPQWKMPTEVDFGCHMLLFFVLVICPPSHLIKRGTLTDYPYDCRVAKRACRWKKAKYVFCYEMTFYTKKSLKRSKKQHYFFPFLTFFLFFF
jgi:hypothetical protein